MKKVFIAVVGLAAVVLPAASLATGLNLTNGGFGQVANNPQSFGVAICDAGKTAVSEAVPVTVAVGSQTANITSASPIKAGGCAYSYLTYSQLGMQPGTAYSVTVTIDPARTMIVNANNQTVYSITVPGSSAAAAQATTPAVAQTANANAQSGDFFSAIVNWLSGLFKPFGQ